MGREAAAATATPFSLPDEDKVLPVPRGERIYLSSATFKPPQTNGQLVGSDTPFIILNLYNKHKQRTVTYIVFTVYHVSG